jgi:hypothetical protein
MQVFHGRRPAVVARFYVVVSSVSEVFSEGENDGVSRRDHHRRNIPNPTFASPLT